MTPQKLLTVTLHHLQIDLVLSFKYLAVISTKLRGGKKKKDFVFSSMKTNPLFFLLQSLGWILLCCCSPRGNVRSVYSQISRLSCRIRPAETQRQLRFHFLLTWIQIGPSNKRGNIPAVK